MFKTMRVLVLLSGFVAALAATAGSASATSWTNSGSTAFTATAAPVTISNGSSTLTCTGATLAGTAPATEAGPTYTLSSTSSYSGCRLNGLASAMTCTHTLTLVPPVTGGLVNFTTALSCSVTVAGREICRLSGSVTGRMRNAATGSPGVLTYNSSTSVRAANGSAGTCPFGSGANVTVAGSGSSASIVFTVTSGTGGSGVLGVGLSQP